MMVINRNEFNSLHRYFIWANKMRILFDEQLKSKNTDDRNEIFVEPFMSYWYGGLYTLIEGWKELKLQDKIIDDLLSQSDNLELLRRYRNGSFHYQKDYFDSRFTEFVSANQSAYWVRNLNREFGRFFLEFIRNNNS